MSLENDPLTASEGPQIAVLCDFDGTIVPCDTVELIYEGFAGPPCPELNRQWIRGEISTQEELQGCFATIKASRAELEPALASVQVDASFGKFLGFCEQQGHRFAIVSDGLDWIIDFVLERHGMSGLTIFCNEVHFEPGGLRFSFPWYDPRTPLRGVSKSAVVRRYQSEGLRVVFIGDGLTDTDAVKVADVVYARDRLLEHCRQHGIPAAEFSDFADLLDKWGTP